MRREYIFLSLLIPGPKSPGKSLDVYLRPLIDELKIVWEDGANIFDAWKRQNFTMRATLMWTISDLTFQLMEC
jgi:phosphoribosylaminoimidazole-succinocarboxamide synthase